MILDQHGNPVEPRPQPHRFGQFTLPEGSHIKGFGGITADGDDDVGLLRSSTAAQSGMHEPGASEGIRH